VPEFCVERQNPLNVRITAMSKMNEYFTQRAKWSEDGQEVQGWLVHDTVGVTPGGTTIVAKIYGGDSGSEFKKALSAAGVLER
jgi:hypothetical protein